MVVICVDASKGQIELPVSVAWGHPMATTQPTNQQAGRATPEGSVKRQQHLMVPSRGCMIGLHLLVLLCAYLHQTVVQSCGETIWPEGDKGARQNVCRLTGVFMAEGAQSGQVFTPTQAPAMPEADVCRVTGAIP